MRSPGPILLEYDSPPIRALLQAIPFFGNLADNALMEEVSQIRARRLKVFFDELASGATSLDEATIRGEPFLHAYFSTVSAAVKTRRDEKIVLFARLLKSGAAHPESFGDEYEDLLGILDEASYRELAALEALSSLEESEPPAWFDLGEMENPSQTAACFSSKFRDRLEELRLPLLSHQGFLKRLERTGMFRLFDSVYGGNIMSLGHTTALYWRLANRIRPRKPAPRLVEIQLALQERISSEVQFVVKGVAHNTSRFPIRGFQLRLELFTGNNFEPMAEKTVDVSLEDGVDRIGANSRHAFGADFHPLPEVSWQRYRVRVVAIDRTGYIEE